MKNNRQDLEYNLLNEINTLTDDDLVKLTKYIKKTKNRYKSKTTIDIFNNVHDFGLEGKRGVVEGETYICKHCDGVATVLKSAFGIEFKAKFDGPANCKFGILAMNQSKVGIEVKLRVDFNNIFGSNPIDANVGTVHKCVQCPPEFVEKYRSN
jgi:hypothetical protein